MSIIRERTPAPGALRIGGVILTAFFAVMALLAITGLIDVQPGDKSIFYVGMAIGGVLGASVAVQSLLLEIDENRVRIRLFPFYWRAFEVKDIASVRSAKIEPSRYGGFGVRRVPGRPLAVFQRGGPGLDFRFRDGRALLVECHDLDRALEALKGRLPEAG